MKYFYNFVSRLKTLKTHQTVSVTILRHFARGRPKLERSSEVRTFRRTSDFRLMTIFKPSVGSYHKKGDFEIFFWPKNIKVIIQREKQKNPKISKNFLLQNLDNSLTIISHRHSTEQRHHGKRMLT